MMAIDPCSGDSRELREGAVRSAFGQSPHTSVNLPWGWDSWGLLLTLLILQAQRTPAPARQFPELQSPGEPAGVGV